MTVNEIRDLIANGDISRNEILFTLKDAARTNAVEALQILKDAGVDMNSSDDLGRTALYHAAWYGALDSIRFLLAVPGIDVNRANAVDGDTPLMQAACYNEVGAVQLLLSDSRVSRGVKNKYGMTAYDVAVSNGSTACADLLRPQPVPMDPAEKAGKIIGSLIRVFWGG